MTLDEKIVEAVARAIASRRDAWKPGERVAHDYVADARAAITAYQAEAWQPIETAPKDGTWIELYRPPADFGWWKCLIKARWHQFEDGDAAWAWPDEEYDLTTEDERDRSLAFIENGDNYEATDGFTHWRHLTPPPAPKASP